MIFKLNTKIFFKNLILVLFVFLASSCKDEKKLYSVILKPSNNSSYEIVKTKTYSIKATPRLGEFTYLGSADIEKLLKHFIFIELEFINNGSVDIIFNPSMSSLLTNDYDLRKPIDLPDLYQMLGENLGYSQTERELRKIKNKFFDRNEKIKPGKTVKKYIILRPFKKDKNKNAVYKIQELYIGSTPVAVNFNFTLGFSEIIIKEN